jgi:hypothetical protein
VIEFRLVPIKLEHHQTIDLLPLHSCARCLPSRPISIIPFLS